MDSQRRRSFDKSSRHGLLEVDEVKAKLSPKKILLLKGGMIGTTIGPKGIVKSKGEGSNYHKEMEKKKFDK